MVTTLLWFSSQKDAQCELDQAGDLLAHPPERHLRFQRHGQRSLVPFFHASAGARRAVFLNLATGVSVYTVHALGVGNWLYDLSWNRTESARIIQGFMTQTRTRYWRRCPSAA